MPKNVYTPDLWKVRNTDPRWPNWAERIDVDMIVTNGTHRPGNVGKLFHVNVNCNRVTERGFKTMQEGMSYGERLWPKGYQRIVAFIPDGLSVSKLQDVVQDLRHVSAVALNLRHCYNEGTIGYRSAQDVIARVDAALKKIGVK